MYLLVSQTINPVKMKNRLDLRKTKKINKEKEEKQNDVTSSGDNFIISSLLPVGTEHMRKFLFRDAEGGNSYHNQNPKSVYGKHSNFLKGN